MKYMQHLVEDDNKNNLIYQQGTKPLGKNNKEFEKVSVTQFILFILLIIQNCYAMVTGIKSFNFPSVSLSSANVVWVGPKKAACLSGHFSIYMLHSLKLVNTMS